MVNPLFIRMLIAGAILAACFGAGWKAQGWRLGAEIDRLKAEHSEAVAKAETEAREATEELRKREQENAQRMQDEEAKRQAENKRQSAIAASLKSERDGLRNAISAYAQAYGTAEDSATAARDRAVPSGTYFKRHCKVVKKTQLTVNAANQTSGVCLPAGLSD